MIVESFVSFYIDCSASIKLKNYVLVQVHSYLFCKCWA